MIETEISISINRKSDIDVIKKIIIDANISSPIYIYEYESHFNLALTSDYEQWELDSAILECFPEYEFTSELSNGKKEIRLQLSRYQSELSTDDWGRPIDNPLDETKYLIKKSNNNPEDFNPRVTVMFEDEESYYYVHTVDGINRATGERGFLLLNNFQSMECDSNTEIFKDKLYTSRHEAFCWGCDKMRPLVQNDFKKYLEKKKKAIKEEQKLPRKIIRDFISACNKSDIKYIESTKNDLCGYDYKIRSQWSIKLPTVNIWVKYFPISSDNENRIQQYKRLNFILKENKIISITKEI